MIVAGYRPSSTALCFAVSYPFQRLSSPLKTHRTKLRGAAPAASFKRPYRNCPGIMFRRSTQAACAGALPIRIWRYAAKWHRGTLAGLKKSRSTATSTVLLSAVERREDGRAEVESLERSRETCAESGWAGAGLEPFELTWDGREE